MKMFSRNFISKINVVTSLLGYKVTVIGVGLLNIPQFLHDNLLHLIYAVYNWAFQAQIGFSLEEELATSCKANTLYSGSVLNTGNRPLYTINGLLQPLSPLEIDGPLRGLFHVFSAFPEFSAFTIYIRTIFAWNLFYLF